MKRYLTEFLGTFILMFLGTGAAIADEVTHGGVTHIGVAICFGLIVMALIYTIGDISGAHMNPAVTIGFAVNHVFKWNDVPPYIISQIAGAFAGSLVLHYIFPESLFLGATLPVNGAMQSFILELILTFILMFVVLRVATGSKEQGLFAGVAIGSIILVEAMFAGPISGASMNPARSLAPAIVSGHTEHLWIYLSAPVIGALLAVIIHHFLKK